MKATLLHSFFFTLIFSLLSLGSQAQLRFTANLSGQNQVFPVATLGHGQVTVYLAGQKIVFEGSIEGLSSEIATDILGGAHMHFGMAGQNGPVIIPIVLDIAADGKSAIIDPLKNIRTLTVKQMDFLIKRRTYINIHTERYRGGEIRGQLLPASEEYYHANLFGNNEVPAVLSTAWGAIDIELNDNIIFVSGSFSNLESPVNTNILGGAHIHVGLPNENGAVVFPLTANIAPDGRSGLFVGSKNAFELTQAQLDDLRARRWYVNIHTTNNIGGELRGQVVGSSRALFRAHLSGMNSVPNQVQTDGRGVLLAEIQDDETLLLFGGFDQLEGEVATNIAGGIHLHRGLAGQTGPVEFPINVDLAPDLKSAVVNASDNQLTLSPTQMNTFLNRSMYMNVHSTSHLSGEIRGQLQLESQMVFTGLFSGAFEVTPVMSDGYGTLKAEVNGDRMVLTGAFDQMNTAFDPNVAGGAHLHQGYAGQNGPIAQNIIPTLAADLRSGRYEANDNILTLDADQLLALREREMYANIHTTGQPGGELRAQLLFEASNYYFATLSGESKNPPVNTPGYGALTAEVSGPVVRMAGSFSNLDTEFDASIGGGAHIHNAIAGRNGGVALGLSADVSGDLLSGVFPVGDNSFNLNLTQQDEMRNRMLYANIHTFGSPSGEIRGQMLPPAASYFTTSLSSRNQIPQLFTESGGGLELELRGNMLVVTGSFDDLNSDFNPNVAGGAHLHLGAVGTNGMVAVRLSPSIDPDNRGGVFLPTNNSFVLSPDNVDNIKRNLFYANIHAVDNPAGEPRGQVLPIINFFPEASPINMPADGASLTVEGDPTSTLDVDWNPSSDDTDVIYYWQISADPDFATLAYSASAGLMSNLGVDFATLDFVLDNAGIAVGETVTLYHRAVASDGSLRNPGPANSVVVTRGSLTGSKGLDDNNDFDINPKVRALQVSVFPNPAIDQVNVSWESEENQIIMIRLIDVNGRVQLQQEIDAFSGFNNAVFNISNLQDGLYYLQMNNTESQKILKSTRP
jgi:hypothetical protein